MKKSIVIYQLVIFSFFALKIDAQTEGEQKPINTPLKNYFQKLILSDSTAQASLLNIRYQYLYIQPNKPFRRGGTSFVVGLNLARFFSNKFILGLSVDTRIFFMGLTRQHFSNAFTNDFNSNYISSYSNQKDSICADVLYKGINGNTSYYVNGSYPAYFGISFSPFPQKYGGLLLELKSGGSSFVFYGDYPSELLNDYGEKGELLLNTKKNISIELSFKPYRFLNSKPIRLFESKKTKDFLNFIIISLYYENFSLKGATFNNAPLNFFVDQKFIDKYSNKNYFGIKLGIGFY